MPERRKQVALAQERLSYIVKNTAKNGGAALLPLRRREGGGIWEQPRLAAEVLVRLAIPLQAAGFEVEGAQIVELGPGRSPELAAALLLAGAGSALLLDTDLRVPDDALQRRRYGALIDALATSPTQFLELTGTSIEALRAALDGPLLNLHSQRYDGAHIPAQDASVDLIYSKSVLEHVAPGCVRALLEEHHRVLRPGGLAVHLIDLRDHLHVVGDHQVDGDWLEALQWSDHVFRIMFSRRSTAINRMRAPEWRTAFEAAGLTIEHWSTRHQPLDGAFNSTRVNARWRSLSEAELSVAWVDVAVRQSDPFGMTTNSSVSSPEA